MRFESPQQLRQVNLARITELMDHVERDIRILSNEPEILEIPEPEE